MLSLDDTIVAIASAPGGSPRGIVRLSGPNVVQAVATCFQPRENIPLTMLATATVVSGEMSISGPIGALPCDLYLWPNSRSYTRQPMAEFHTFGSPPILAAIVRTLCTAGARAAQPGEFTLRAFLAGRIDLTQAEAVLGVIDATGDRQFQSALKQLSGGLSSPLHELRESLLGLLAHLEAGLDFAEEDIEFIAPAELLAALETASRTIANLIEQMHARTTSTELPSVVLIGLPNVGKSSLYNALVGRNSAIVSNQPGTTRDYLTATVNFASVSCNLVDTAGIDAATQPASIENAAQNLATSQRETAHVTILCLDASRPLEACEREWLAAHTPQSRIIALTKCDRPRQTDFQAEVVETSAATGLGLDALANAVKQSITASASDIVAGTAERCHDSLRRAAESLQHARSLVTNRGGDELIAAELRNTLDELGKVVGAVYTDDILDRIFSRFCIGK